MTKNRLYVLAVLALTAAAVAVIQLRSSDGPPEKELEAARQKFAQPVQDFYCRSLPPGRDPAGCRQQRPDQDAQDAYCSERLRQPEIDQLICSDVPVEWAPVAVLQVRLLRNPRGADEACDQIRTRRAARYQRTYRRYTRHVRLREEASLAIPPGLDYVRPASPSHPPGGGC